MTKRDIEIAKYLSSHGTNFSEQLRADNSWYFENLGNSYFSIAMAIGLTWTKHAQFDGEFIEYASNYIDSKVAVDPNMAIKFCYRFGSEELANALLNYRRYYKEIRTIMPNFSSCDVHTLAKLQQRMLTKLDNLRTDGRVFGIGPWLFSGPFKIILSDQHRLWEEDGINTIVLPTGMEVDKGIDRLIDEKYTFMKDFDKSWLEETTRSLLDNYATYHLVHTFIVNIGHIAKTPALHINSALYLYGKSEI